MKGIQKKIMLNTISINESLNQKFPPYSIWGQ